MRGTVEPRDLVSIAVVGSRYATPAGIIFTEKICSDLARSGVTVVSGFAVGIDSAAHRGTIKAGGRTLAVLGCGVDVNYPAMNADLGREIVRSGAILSEFPLGTPPNSGHFPGRNRIISGLSLGVVVVEAAEKSGSLITARYALEQGREVFAVPGMARSMRSKGAHQLIKQGAKLIEDAEDVLEEIRPLIRSSQQSTSPGFEGKIQSDASSSFAKRGGEDKGGAETSYSPEERTLLKILDKIPKHIDEIVQEKLHACPARGRPPARIGTQRPCGSTARKVFYLQSVTETRFYTSLQSSITSPGTRSNSLTLFVTNIRPNSLA